MNKVLKNIRNLIIIHGINKVRDFHTFNLIIPDTENKVILYCLRERFFGKL